jgi:glucan phosphoethanolaminetransferase (alkaline phosphatase superfamily)
MTIGGLAWMLSALILTPILSKGDAKLRKVNPAVMAVVPTAALLGAFFTLAFTEVVKSPAHLVTMLASAGAMGVCLLLAHRLRLPWLREWGLGLSIVVALATAYFMTAA